MFKPYWYISFVNNRKECLGGCMVAGDNEDDALAEATRRGINPGGNALIVPVFQSIIGQMAPYLNRLVPKEELIQRGGIKVNDMDAEGRKAIGYYAAEICEDCNKPND